MASRLQLPESSTTVGVRLIDTTTLVTIKSEFFVKPVQPGHEIINITDVAFLIEHGPSGKKMLFDLGCRKDYWNLPTAVQERLGDVIPSLRVDKDIREILQENGIALGSICKSVLSLRGLDDHVSGIVCFSSLISVVKLSIRYTA